MDAREVEYEKKKDVEEGNNHQSRRVQLAGHGQLDKMLAPTSNAVIVRTVRMILKVYSSSLRNDAFAGDVIPPGAVLVPCHGDQDIRPNIIHGII
jgi:hypothetical protein